jgi:hypothetical protein
MDLCPGNAHRLAISGKLQQKRIQPLELSASLPFDIPKIVRARKLPDETPITAKARLPRSSVNFLRQFVPAVAQLDGEVALDVDVKGTIGRPVLSGAGDIKVNVARLQDPTLPALQNLNTRLDFAGDTVTLQRFGGEAAVVLSQSVASHLSQIDSTDCRFAGQSQQRTRCAKRYADRARRRRHQGDGTFHDSDGLRQRRDDEQSFFEKYRSHSDRFAGPARAGAAVVASGDFFAGPAVP